MKKARRLSGARRRKKGILSTAIFLMVALGVVTLLVVGGFLVYFRGVIGIKSQLSIYMANDDAGTELLSVLNSKQGDLKNIEALGWYAAGIGNANQIESTLKSVSPSGYDFTFRSEANSITFKQGTGAAIPSCGSSISPGDVINLMWPIPNQKEVISGFGLRAKPKEPNKGICECHGGIDISGGGADVYAAAPGTVKAIVIDETTDPNSGRYVKIEHVFGSSIYYSYYFHLDSVPEQKDLYVGRAVCPKSMKGMPGCVEAFTDPIGKSKVSGEALHFEIRNKRGEADADSIYPCDLFTDDKGNKMTIDKCFHDAEPACQNMGYWDPQNMVYVQNIMAYETDVPLPGAKAGSCKGTAIMKENG